MSSLHLTYLPKCLVAQVAPMYQHLSLRTADVSPRSSLLRDVSRGGLHRSLFLPNWIINASNKSGRAVP